MSSENKLKVNPTGCPGPIPGTKVWRCDGLNCVYGTRNYASCKQAIADRGYTLRLSSDLIAEASEAAQLIEQNAQGQLKAEQKAHANTMTQLNNKEAYIQLQDEERKHLVDILAESYAGEQHYKEELWNVTQSNGELEQLAEEQQDHIADLLASNAQLRDELRWIYAKQGREESIEEVTDSSAGELSGSDNTDTTVSSDTSVEEQE